MERIHTLIPLSGAEIGFILDQANGPNSAKYASEIEYIYNKMPHGIDNTFVHKVIRKRITGRLSFEKIFQAIDDYTKDCIENGQAPLEFNKLWHY